MIRRSNKGTFLKRSVPPEHKQGCGCFRCTGISFMKGRKQTSTHRVKNVESHKGQVPWNKGIPSSEKSKEKNRVAHLGKSSPNKGKKFLQYSGDKHPNWKGGATPKNRKIRNSLEYALWRNVVFDRDGYTCQECGVKNEKGLGKSVRLEVHHIESFVNNLKKRFDIDNGITLCKDCHRQTDSFGRSKDVVTAAIDGWISYAIVSV